MYNRELPILGGRRNKTKLNEKLCFELWLDRGTVRKAAQAAFDEYGVESPKCPGKPYTIRGFELAAKRFVLWHPEEARQMYENYYAPVEDNIWYDYMKRIYYSYIKYYSPERAVAWRKEFSNYWEYIEQNS